MPFAFSEEECEFRRFATHPPDDPTVAAPSRKSLPKGKAVQLLDDLDRSLEFALAADMNAGWDAWSGAAAPPPADRA